jgi:hypothetical protein
MRQPIIALLEHDGRPPSLVTLARITAGTGAGFHLYGCGGTVASQPE